MKKILVSLGLFSGLTLFGAASSGSQPRLVSYRWGLSAMQGNRRTMEDTHTVKLDFKGNPNQAYFGVYDGHGGRLAADYTAAQLDTNIANLGFSEGFKKTHLDYGTVGNAHAGTTVIVATTQEQPGNTVDLSFAWAGDARGILVDNNKQVLYATKDHKPDDPAEEERIKAAGGWVMPGSEFGGPARVNGILAVARAIGDSAVQGVTYEPDVQNIPLNRNAAYIILACDGVWDVITNEQAAQIVADAFEQNVRLEPDNARNSEQEGNDDTAIMAARALRNAAYMARSGDNISVIVAKLEWQNQQAQQPQIISYAATSGYNEPVAPQVTGADAGATLAQRLDAILRLDSVVNSRSANVARVVRKLQTARYLLNEAGGLDAALENLREASNLDGAFEIIGTAQGNDVNLYTYLYELIGLAEWSQRRAAPAAPQPVAPVQGASSSSSYTNETARRLARVLDLDYVRDASTPNARNAVETLQTALVLLEEPGGQPAALEMIRDAASSEGAFEALAFTIEGGITLFELLQQEFAGTNIL